MGIISPIGVDSNGNPLGTGSPQILGKEDFLRLLVAKLTHQDPLNPVTDEAFVADLAQFSSLEQLQNLNEALGSSLQWDLLQMQTINNTMATSLIGKEVKASYSSIYLSEDNNPGIGFSTTEYAESIKVTIMNSDGAVVRTIVREDIPPGDNSITWDGKDDNGKRLAEGFYQIKISGINGEGDSFSPSSYVRALVTGVVYHDGSAYLQVNGMEIPLGNVAAIYAAEPEGEG